MTKKYSIFVGTVGIGGAGIWCSRDSGYNWFIPKGGIDESDCCALTPDIWHPGVIYAGLNNGIHRSDDGGINFHRIESPINAFGVWSVAIDPVEEGTVFVGCRPGAIFKTRDGGHRWEKKPADFVEEGMFGGPTRVLVMAVDPTDNRIVWAGVEADGLRRSLDGGETWDRIDWDITDNDLHGLAIVPSSNNTVFASSNTEIFLSCDVGESWAPLGIRDSFPTLKSCRHIAVKTDDPKVLFLGLGDTDNGVVGTVARSSDRGKTWEGLQLPVEPNTPIWNLAVHPSDPNIVVCTSHYGQIFISEDAGESWRKAPREFSEIRALAWMPNDI